MKILGLNLIHDTSAALIIDGKIIGAVEEERFNRIRHSTNFPHYSIDWLLKLSGLEINELDFVVNSFDTDLFYENTMPFELNTINHDDIKKNSLEILKIYNHMAYYSIQEKLNRNGISKCISVPHHLAHASGAYFTSGLDTANVLVLDGRGEVFSTSILYAEGGKFTVIKQWDIEHSIGHLYTYLTFLSGLYSSAGQEGKTMGLAAQGNPLPAYYENALSKILHVSEENYSIDRSELRKLYTLKRKLGNIDQVSSYLSSLAQQACEKIVLNLSEIAFRQTGCSNFVLSGGVALNCEANRKLYSKNFVKNLYIQPSANDGGTSLGAAIYQNSLVNKKKLIFDSDVYIGPSFTNREIKKALNSTFSEYIKLDCPSKTAAQLLASGYIIGWFQGGCEFGPRALGNRSILSDPRQAKFKDIINLRVKHRESWRPFAPSILQEYVHEWFENAYFCPHMTCSFIVKEDKRDLIPAVVHTDNTARVQAVSREKNASYYDLIKAFNDITGVPVVLNTSFNDRGQPLVNNPQDALATFYSTGLDVLIIGKYLLKKSHVKLTAEDEDEVTT